MSTAPATSSARRVAIVGSGDAATQAVGLLEQLGMEPVVYGDAPGGGDAASIERLETLRGVDFAIFLPSQDAGAAPTLLAIGFLLAVVGRGRICLLAPGTQATMPLLGAATRVEVDDGGLWHLLLAREMKRAGLDVDLNRAM